MIATTPITSGASPAIRNSTGSPSDSPAGPATAIDTGMNASETKKSRLETRPSMAAGTRRCSSVPQITTPPLNAAPTRNAAITMTQIWSVRPNTASGRHPNAQSRFITVR
jgi:hypothetical protein